MGTSSSITSVVSRPALPHRFEIIKILGDGAAGVVYQVKDNLRKGEVVALKVLSNSGAFDEHTLARFNKELEVARGIDSPHVVQAFELIEFEDTVAFTMEFVPGSDLGNLCRQKRMSVPEIKSIMLQVLHGLEALHKKGVVHRDIKLENILVRNDAVVKISDLGLMKQTEQKLTRTGILLGTAQYLPPEYIRGSDYDARGDIYTTGLILLELLCGRRWLEEKSGNQAIDHLLKTNFKIPAEYWANVPDDMRLVIERATALNPQNRYQSAGEMREALERTGSKKVVSNGSGVRIHPKMCSMRTFRNKQFTENRSSRIIIGALLAGILGAVSVFVFGMVTGNDTEMQSDHNLVRVFRPRTQEPVVPVDVPAVELRGDIENPEVRGKPLEASGILKGQLLTLSLPILGCDAVELGIEAAAAKCARRGVSIMIDETLGGRLQPQQLSGVVVDREKGKAYKWTLRSIDKKNH